MSKYIGNVESRIIDGPFRTNPIASTVTRSKPIERTMPWEKNLANSIVA